VSDGVCEVTVVRGAQAGDVPDLLIEVPHGATKLAHFTELRDLMKSALPASLEDFFLVNTDQGSPEYARGVADRIVAADPRRSVKIVRALIPRTLIDVNRDIDASAEDYKAGKVTPGVPPYIRDAGDRELLVQRYRNYQEVARAAYEEVCGAGGSAMMLHTYAPRSVDVEVDDDIVTSLRWAYTAENVGRWHLRPEVDVIGSAPGGVQLAPAALVEALHAGFSAVGIQVADGETYPLHPSTTAYHHAARWPQRTLCLEVRRDLLADPFDPFAEMNISASNVDRIAGPIASAWLDWVSGRA
jgi:predicted N-formylglutamate amidohydrolase